MKEFSGRGQCQIFLLSRVRVNTSCGSLYMSFGHTPTHHLTLFTHWLAGLPHDLSSPFPFPLFPLLSTYFIPVASRDCQLLSRSTPSMYTTCVSLVAVWMFRCCSEVYTTRISLVVYMDDQSSVILLFTIT